MSATVYLCKEHTLYAVNAMNTVLYLMQRTYSHSGIISDPNSDSRIPTLTSPLGERSELVGSALLRGPGRFVIDYTSRMRETLHVKLNLDIQYRR